MNIVSHAMTRIIPTVFVHLTSDEVRELRKVCKELGLNFAAEAARPRTALTLIGSYRHWTKNGPLTPETKKALARELAQNQEPS